MGERSAARDDAEFDALVVAHHGEIRRYLSRVASREGAAEDLSQETFLRAYRAWGERPPDRNRRAWLYTIATNAYRNHVRAERRRRSAYASVRIVRREVERHGPEDEAVARQARERTEAAIRALPLKQRLAFTMRKLEELEYEVIGHSLGCSAETARAHVFRALRKLRAFLADPARPARSGR